MKSCFMFGHADCPDSILPKIEKAIELYYSEYGIQDFYVGNRGQFDHLAVTAVRHSKQRHSDIRLYLLLAYHPGERAVDLTDGFDNSFYPPLVRIPRPYAIVRANRYMVNTTDSIICYAKHTGNARNLFEYAKQRQQKRELTITNVAETTG